MTKKPTNKKAAGKTTFTLKDYKSYKSNNYRFMSYILMICESIKYIDKFFLHIKGAPESLIRDWSYLHLSRTYTVVRGNESSQVLYICTYMSRRR